MLVIVNPKGGGGRAERVLARARLEIDGLELTVQRTRHPGHAAELVREGSLADHDTVVVVGGDGTIHEVVNALMERERAQRPALGLLPGGTGNSLAHDLGLVNVERAREALLNPRRRTMDLLRVRTSNRSFYAFNMVGWGLPATAGARAEAFRWLGPSRYTVASMIEIMLGRPQTVEFETGGERRIGAYPAIIICNTRHIGTGMQMAPLSRLDDGLMDVVILEPASRLQILRLLLRVYDGSHVGDRNVSYLQVDRFLLQMKRAGQLNVDGELLETEGLQVEVVPRAIDVIGAQ